MIFAAVLSLAIGVSLGLLGGGGSILTMPILIYALHVPEKEAIATSLIVVGTTSAVAAIQHARSGNVVWRVALAFAAGGAAGAFTGGRVAKYIPSSILLILFAVMMLVTAAAMWRGRSASTTTEVAPQSLARVAIQGVIVGLATGLVGAGGGFLIVPALALLGGLPMHRAIGSSLVVITLNSFAGFLGYISHVDIDYQLASVVTGAAVVGSFGGAAIGRRVSQEKLRRGFAVFVVVMAIYLLYKQLF